MTVRDNQRRMVANTLRAGGKLTAAQKANFSGVELNKIRSSLANESIAVKKARMASGVATRAKPTVKTGGKKAGQGLGRRRGTKITGGRGAALGRERSLARKRVNRRVKTGTGAGGDIKRRRGTP